MSLQILQDKHDKIREDLEEELVRCRNLLAQKIGENGPREYAKSCSHCLSRLEILSNDLETALANLSLKVEGAEAEHNFDCETNRDFALLDSAMELSDELTYLKSHVTEKIKQNEICKEKSGEDRFSELISKQYEQLQLLIAMTSTQIIDPLPGDNYLEPLELTKFQAKTNSEQQDESIFEKTPADFGTQNMINEIQDITTHDKRDRKIPKEQINTNQVKSHGNKTRKLGNRKRRKGEQMDTLANLKQVLKTLKRKLKQNKKKRGNSKLDSTVGSEPLLKLKLSQKHIILKKLTNGKCIKNKRLQNESRFKKQTHQGNLRGAKNLRIRRKTKKQRKKVTVDRNQRCSFWCKTVFEKSVAEPKRTRAFYSWNGYLGKYGGRSNKRSQRDHNACDGDKNNDGRDDNHDEGQMHFISNSYLEQASNMQQ